MQIRNTRERFGAVAQALHWAIVILILAQFVLASIFEDMPTGLDKIEMVVRHKTVGMTILMLAIVRLIWRIANPVPPLPNHQKTWERWLAHSVHGLLYLLIFAIPLSGWIMSSLAGVPVDYFGWFDFPDLVTKNKAWVEAAEQTHETLGKALIAVAVLHVAGALKHHFVDKDDVLLRMLPRWRR